MHARVLERPTSSVVEFFSFSTLPCAAKIMDPDWVSADDGLDELTLINVKVSIVTTVNAIGALLAWYS